MPSDIILNDDDINVIGNVFLKAEKSRPQRISLDTAYGNIWLGGDGADGDLVLNAGDGTQRVHIDATRGSVDPHVRAYIGGAEGSFLLGGDGEDGELSIKDFENRKTVDVKTDTAEFTDRGGSNRKLDMSQTSGVNLYYPKTGKEVGKFGHDPWLDQTYLSLNTESGANLIRLGTIGKSMMGTGPRPYVKIQDSSGNVYLETVGEKLRTTDINVEGLNKSLVEKIGELEAEIADLKSRLPADGGRETE